jgi:hypothetical protein
MFQYGLKAGAIGGAVALVLALLSLIPVPVLGCCILFLYVLLWLGVGALAARFGAAVVAQTTGEAAGAGAIAGAITGVIGGIFNVIVTAVQMALGLGTQIIRQIPPEQLRMLEESGIPPEVLTWMGGIGGTFVCCCLGGAILAAGLGALGGLLYASIAK